MLAELGLRPRTITSLPAAAMSRSRELVSAGRRVDPERSAIARSRAPLRLSKCSAIAAWTQGCSSWTNTCASCSPWD